MVSLKWSGTFCDGCGYLNVLFNVFEGDKGVISGSEKETRSLCGSPMGSKTQDLTLRTYNKGLFWKRTSEQRYINKVRLSDFSVTVRPDES